MLWRCDLVPQYEAYKAEIDAAIQGVLTSGRYTLAREVTAFEAEFAEYCGTRFGVGVNSGTDALMLALACAGVRPGDEVITTPFTAIPTYSAIRHVGAIPVFVDIDLETQLIDLSQVADAMTDRTKAIVPVHLFGNAVDIGALREIVGPSTIILEDAAQAHGATVKGQRVGSMGNVGAFSFYPTKNLGGYGDGGMAVTDSEELADEIRRRRMYGMVNKDEFDRDGINSRLDELQAAILRVKLRHLDAMNQRRTELDALYREHLPEAVQPQRSMAGVQSVFHVYAALCSERRDELVAYLEEQGIQTNIYYPLPLYRQEAHVSQYGPHASLPVAEQVCDRIIALPFYPEMPEETVVQVAQLITRFYS